MNISAIIPARMSSSRFPGKPMARILGKPMIEHVYENVTKCELLKKTVVATCDTEIFDFISSIGGHAVMTLIAMKELQIGCRSSNTYRKEDNIKYDIVVLMQGDEPMTHPDMISEAVYPMINNSDIIVTNLLGEIKDEEEFEDRNCIKVVCDKNSNALFFSREPIPTRKFGKVAMKKQVCVIPFTRDFLLEYTNLNPTPLEIAESIDMMRVLEHGKKVKMIPTQHQTHSVDTKEDLVFVENLMKERK